MCRLWKSTRASTASEPDENFTWQQAKDWAAKQTACKAEWKVPVTSQLNKLFDRRYTAGKGWFERGQYWPAHIDPIFDGIGDGSWVWASSPGTAFNFNQGIEVKIPSEGFYGTVRVFAVRSTP